MSPAFEDAAHSLKGKRHVIDVRNLGLVAGVEFAPREGKPGARAYEAFVKCLERGVLVRATGDTLAISPPLIVDAAQIARIFDTIAEALSGLE